MPTDELTGFKRMFLARGLSANADLSVAILAGATLGGGMTVNWTTSIDAPPRRPRARGRGTTGSRASRARDGRRLRPHEGRSAGRHGRRRSRSRTDCSSRAAMPSATRLRPMSGTRPAATPVAAAASAAGSGPSGPASAAISPSLRLRRPFPGRRPRRSAWSSKAGRAVGVEGRLLVLDATGLPTEVARPFRVHARQVVLAAGALRTPVIVLASGRAHPWTGHGLRLHPVAALAGVMPEPVEMWAGPLQSARSLQFLEPGPAAAGYAGPAHGPIVLESAPPHPGLAGSAFPWIGPGRQRGLHGAALLRGADRRAGRRPRRRPGEPLAHRATAHRLPDRAQRRPDGHAGRGRDGAHQPCRRRDLDRRRRHARGLVRARWPVRRAILRPIPRRPRRLQLRAEPDGALLRPPDGQHARRRRSRHERLRPVGPRPRGYGRRHSCPASTWATARSFRLPRRSTRR